MPTVYMTVAVRDVPSGTVFGEYGGDVLASTGKAYRDRIDGDAGRLHSTAIWVLEQASEGGGGEGEGGGGGGGGGGWPALVMTCDRTQNELAYANDYRTDVAAFNEPLKNTARQVRAWEKGCAGGRGGGRFQKRVVTNAERNRRRP